MNVLRLDLSFFTAKLDNAEPFSFSRYGDGEFLAMKGERGMNADRSEYWPELGAELRQTLLEPRSYLHAIGPKARHADEELGRWTVKFLAEQCPPIPWYSSETFLAASLKGELHPLVQALAGRKVLLVGPAHLRRLPVIEPVAFVEVPAVNCYLQKDEIERAIRHEAWQADVIAFSAGMATEVMLYDLFPALGQTHTLCDFGSLWDMYCGVDSRRYARRMSADIKALLFEQNFGVAYAAQ